jgi:hypothetical protein
VVLDWQSAAGREFRVFYANDFADVSDVAERSGLVNSLAAQETGSDYTNPYHSARAGAGVAATRGAMRWSLELSREEHRPLEVHASPASGSFQPPIPAARAALWRGILRADRATSIGWLDTEVRYRAELRGASTFGAVATLCAGAACGASTMSLRPALALEIDRPFDRATVRLRTLAAAVISGENVLAQELVFLGGPVTAPGYAFHGLVGNRAVSQTLALEVPIPFPAISLGRFGRSPSSAKVSPHATGVWVHTVGAGTPILRSGLPAAGADPFRPVPAGFHPSFGVSVIAVFDLLRFDVSRAPRPGRWAFSVDISQAFWSIM